MSESETQDVAPDRVGAYVTFAGNDKKRIEDAGQSLIRGEVGSVDSLITAALPLCVIVTGKLTRRYKRLHGRRQEFRDKAREALAIAVASLDRRFRDGTITALKCSFRAYLSKCIHYGLIQYSRQLDRAERDKAMQSFSLEECGFDWVEILSLKRVEKKVFVARMRGKKWNVIAASINRTPRTAQRIFNNVRLRLDPAAAPQVTRNPNRLPG